MRPLRLLSRLRAASVSDRAPRPCRPPFLAAPSHLAGLVAHRRLRAMASAAHLEEGGGAETLGGDCTAEPLEADSAAEAAPQTYEEQLAAKVERLRALFPEAPPVEVFRSPPTHWRMRAEFRVWHEGADMQYIMFRPKVVEGRTVQERFPVQHFERGSRLLNELMGVVRGQVLRSDMLKKKLYQVNFHTTLSGQAMVTMIYHKKLTEAWGEAARQLQPLLAAAPSSTQALVPLIGRSKKQQVVLGEAHVIEKLHVAGRELTYKQVEFAFSQPNAEVCQHMLGWALGVTQGSPGDLLELYCGNGNFTAALAPNFGRVLATEISKSSVATAHHNLAANGAANAVVARLSSEEFVQAWRGAKAFARLQGTDLASYDFRTVFVDPPRAGCDPGTVELLKAFERVVYVSCNPETLRQNLAALAPTHALHHLALFDQFPFTEHIECGAYLRRRDGAEAGPGAGGEAVASTRGEAGAGATGEAGAGAEGEVGTSAGGETGACAGAGGSGAEGGGGVEGSQGEAEGRAAAAGLGREPAPPEPALKPDAEQDQCQPEKRQRTQE